MHLQLAQKEARPEPSRVDAITAGEPSQEGTQPESIINLNAVAQRLPNPEEKHSRIRAREGKSTHIRKDRPTGEGKYRDSIPFKRESGRLLRRALGGKKKK